MCGPARRVRHLHQHHAQLEVQAEGACSCSCSCSCSRARARARLRLCMRGCLGDSCDDHTRSNRRECALCVRARFYICVSENGCASRRGITGVAV